MEKCNILFAEKPYRYVCMEITLLNKFGVFNPRNVLELQKCMLFPLIISPELLVSVRYIGEIAAPAQIYLDMAFWRRFIYLLPFWDIIRPKCD